MRMNLNEYFLKSITYNDEDQKKKLIVLDEDTFVKELDRIIERDFFPNLFNLRNCVKNDNLIDEDCSINNLENEKIISSILDNPNITLQEFLSKYTSEDNASFLDIIKLSKKRHQNKYSWLYKDEKKIQDEIDFVFKVPAIEDQVKNRGNNTSLITWPYKNKNSIMFNPEGAKYTLKEIYEMNATNNQKVVYENTRFKENPFDKKSEVVDQQIYQDKNDYNFVESTPLLEPESLKSPLMTWGEIESSPIKLDATDLNKTPSISSSSTHKFKLQDLSTREKIAQKLTDKFSKSYKQKNVANSVKLRWTPSPLISIRSLNTPKTPRIENMSPAVQRFAANKILKNVQNDITNKNIKNYQKSISNIIKKSSNI